MSRYCLSGSSLSTASIRSFNNTFWITQLKIKWQEMHYRHTMGNYRIKQPYSEVTESYFNASASARKSRSIRLLNSRWIWATNLKSWRTLGHFVPTSSLPEDLCITSLWCPPNSRICSKSMRIIILPIILSSVHQKSHRLAKNCPTLENTEIAQLVWTKGTLNDKSGRIYPLNDLFTASNCSIDKLKIKHQLHQPINKNTLTDLNHTR